LISVWQIRADTRALAWIGFFALILAAWSALFAMSLEVPDATLRALYGADFWRSVCGASGLSAGFGVTLSMWVLMVAAMMMPTFAPSLKTYSELQSTEAANAAGMAMLVLGYVAIWFGFSLLAAGLQTAFLKVGFVSPAGTSLSWGLNSALLILAGFYQFSTFKDACLSRCRAPLTFFMGHWRPGSAGALNMGLRLGAICLGCCWALMLLAFVGGTMNLLWMGLATLVMVAEKLPQIGTPVTRPLGILLIMTGVGAGVATIY